MKLEINIRKEHLIVLIGIIILSPVFAAVVSHEARDIQVGILGLLYDGNWGFMNGSVGINTTTPSHELNVVGDANVTGTLYVSNDSIYVGDKWLRNVNGTIEAEGPIRAREGQSCRVLKISASGANDPIGIPETCYVENSGTGNFFHGGCELREILYTGGAVNPLSTEQAIYIQVVGDGDWAAGSNTGTNGDTTRTLIFGDLYDDSVGITEQNDRQWYYECGSTRCELYVC